MKLSDAILKGMERFPKQLRNGEFLRGNAACALGCAYVAASEVEGFQPRFSNHEVTVPADVAYRFELAKVRFYREFGADLSTLNDAGMPREDIAGMLKAIGE